jgi:hypothetical protein
MWFVPGALGVLSLACGVWAKHTPIPRPLDKLKAQIELDILALRQSQEP